jgi:hypothetical protein
VNLKVLTTKRIDAADEEVMTWVEARRPPPEPEPEEPTDEVIE